MTVPLVFEVQGMHCGGCIALVTRTILELDRRAKVEVDLTAGRVSVASSVAPEAVTAALNGAGYEAKLAG